MKMKVGVMRKPSMRTDKSEINRTPVSNTFAEKPLKSAMVVPKHTPAAKEMFAIRTSSQRYAELPSLRYGPTTIPTSIQMIGSGPLRVSPVTPKNVRATKRFPCQEHHTVNSLPPPGGSVTQLRKSCELMKEQAPPAVRKVRFAELPPKFHSFDGAHGLEEDWADTSRRDTVSRATAASHSHSYGAPSVIPKLGNQGTYIGSTVLKNPAAGRETRHRRSLQPSLTLPPILRAARTEDEVLLLDLLRKAAVLGIPSDELNAVDASGRTAVSYIASNGTLAALEAILLLPGLDVNKPDNEGNTPLHFAAQAGQVEVLNHMLSRCTGLEIDARNSLGFTALMKAALQGRTKCAKLLLFAGASPTMRDSGRGLRAEQWARFCGRYICAEVIEKFAKHQMPDRTTSNGRWGSEPELAVRILTGKLVPPVTATLMHSNSIKNKLRRAFRTTSSPGPDCPPSFSVVTQLTSVAFCASSPLLPVPQPNPKSSPKPLTVPRLQVTLAGSNAETVLTEGSNPMDDDLETSLKERPPTARPAGRAKKKK